MSSVWLGILSGLFMASVAAAAVDFRAVDAMTRVLPGGDLPAAGALHMHAARNEFSPFQLLVTGSTSEIKAAVVSMGDLRSGEGGVLKAPAPEAVRWAFVKQASPHSPLGAGYYPDGVGAGMGPLPPVDGALTQAWWVDVFVPEDARPGDYTGMATLRSGGKEQAVPVRLTVYPAVLPERAGLRSLIGCEWTHIAQAFGLPEERGNPLVRKQTLACHDMLAAHRLQVNEPWPPAIEVDASGHITAFPVEEYAAYFTKRKSNALTMPVWPDWPVKDATGAGRAAVVRYLTEVQQKMKEHGWLEYCVMRCPVDEPEGAAEFAEVRKWAEICDAVEKRSGLPLRMLCVTPPGPQDPAWGSLDGAVDTYVFTPGEFFEDYQKPRPAWKARAAAGCDFWAYNGLVQFPDAFLTSVKGKPGIDRHPPVWLLDFAPMNYRILPWQCAVYGWKGVLYWRSVTALRDTDPWMRTDVFREKDLVFNMDGQLIYAGKDGPVASLRLKWLREGMEDYDLIQTVFRAGDRTVARKAAVLASPSVTGWRATPDTLHEARRMLLEAR